MILSGKNENEVAVVVSTVAVPVSPSSVASTTEDTGSAILQNYTEVAGHNQWDVFSSDYDSVEALNPTSTDISEFPRVKRAATFPAGGTNALIKIRRGVFAKSISLGMADGVIISAAPTCISINSGTVLEYTFSLVNAETAKTNFIFRTKTTLAPVSITSGTDLTSIEANPLGLGGAYDFSGVPVWNSGSNSPHYGMAAISRRHLLGAIHFKPHVGSYVKFIRSDGAIHTNRIIGQSHIPLLGDSDYDVIQDKVVFTLESALPAEVVSYPIPGEWAAEGICLLGVDQNRALKIHTSCSTQELLSLSATYQGISVTNNYPNIVWLNLEGSGFGTIPESGYYLSAGNGDSGGAVFVPTSSGLVLVGCYWTPRKAPFTACESVMNAMIVSADANASVSTGLTVTVAPDPTINTLMIDGYAITIDGRLITTN